MWNCMEKDNSNNFIVTRNRRMCVDCGGKYHIYTYIDKPIGILPQNGEWTNEPRWDTGK